jgi:hypothetical protein
MGNRPGISRWRLCKKHSPRALVATAVNQAGKRLTNRRRKELAFILNILRQHSDIPNLFKVGVTYKLLHVSPASQEVGFKQYLDHTR